MQRAVPWLSLPSVVVRLGSNIGLSTRDTTRAWRSIVLRLVRGSILSDILTIEVKDAAGEVIFAADVVTLQISESRDIKRSFLCGPDGRTEEIIPGSDVRVVLSGMLPADTPLDTIVRIAVTASPCLDRG